MSYEGRFQCICALGHYSEVDHLDFYNKALHRNCYTRETVCPVCSGEVKWWNQVDETNNMDDGVIDIAVLREHFGIYGSDLLRVPTFDETNFLRRTYSSEEMEENCEAMYGDCRRPSDTCLSSLHMDDFIYSWTYGRCENYYSKVYRSAKCLCTVFFCHVPTRDHNVCPFF